MHPNTALHLEKLDASITWLARWGVSDAGSLCRSASHLVGAGVPSVQARHWPQLLVREGFAEVIELEEAQAGARKAFLATRTARLHASALGHALTDPYRLNTSKLAHRLIAQRVVLDLAHYVRSHGGRVLSYTTENEIPAASREEYMERWPDSIVSLELADRVRRKIAIEVEWNVRSAARLVAMTAGLAELLKHPTSIHHLNGVLVLVPSPATAARYAEVMTAGRPYVRHERRGLDFVPTAGVLTVPKGIHVVSGWSVSSDVAGALLGLPEVDAETAAAAAKAAAHEEAIRKATLELLAEEGL